MRKRKFKFHISKSGRTVFVREFPKTIRLEDLAVIVPMLAAMERGMVIAAPYRS